MNLKYFLLILNFLLVPCTVSALVNKDSHAVIAFPYSSTNASIACGELQSWQHTVNQQQDNNWFYTFVDATFLKDHFEKLLTSLVSSLKLEEKKSLTQTEAYLSRPELLESVAIQLQYLFLQRGRFQILPSEDELLKLADRAFEFYKAIILITIQREREFEDHYVFYHAQQNDFRLFYDVLMGIMNWIKKHDNSAFSYLRVPNKPQFNVKLADLLSRGFSTDHDPVIRAILLCVNLSLFGNSNDAGESSFVYFMRNQSIHQLDVLETIFDELNLNKSFILRLSALYAKYLNTGQGNLIQIFIPKNKVNDTLYLSLAYGVPLSAMKDPQASPYARTIKDFHIGFSAPLNPFVVHRNDQAQTYDPKEIDPQTYLEIYRHEPLAIGQQDMDAIQARILLSNELMLNPNAGIHMYHYTTFLPENIIAYRKELQAIIDEIMQTWSSGECSPLSHELMTSVYSLLFCFLSNQCRFIRW